MYLNNNQRKNKQLKSDPAGTRTQDPYIKSVLLYQLSYGIKIKTPFKKSFAKVILINNNTKY